MKLQSRLQSVWGLVAAIVVLPACTPPLPPSQAAAGAAATSASASNAAAAAVPVERDAKGVPKSYSVVAYGYNYTDLYIDSFEVDGAGGGNLAVSSATAGGGKHTCCALVTSGLPLGTTFNIRWNRDGDRWCEQDVPLTQPVPSESRYLEVHFYPDGKVEIEATQKASSPRLKLERFDRGQRKESGNVNNDEKHSRCKDGYR